MSEKAYQKHAKKVKISLSSLTKKNVMQNKNSALYTGSDEQKGI
jgi:hypothetical protein